MTTEKLHEHHFTLRVYYEDTDAGGVVYNANYLKFAERARTEMLREAGLNQTEIRKEHNMVFVVTKASLVYKRPAHLDDVLVVKTALTGHTNSRMTLNQHVWREHTLICAIEVEIATVKIQDDGQSIKAHHTPQMVLDALAGHGITATRS